MKDQYFEKIRKMYGGKKFRYNSKYGGFTDNILCYRVVVCETIKLKKKDFVPIPSEIIIVSDKGNSYPLEQVEFYN